MDEIRGKTWESMEETKMVVITEIKTIIQEISVIILVIPIKTTTETMIMEARRIGCQTEMGAA